MTLNCPHGLWMTPNYRIAEANFPTISTTVDVTISLNDPVD